MGRILEKMVDKLENRVPINEIHKKNKGEQFFYKLANLLGCKFSIYTFRKECSFCSEKLTNDTVIRVVVEKKGNFSLIKQEELHKCPTCKQHWAYDQYSKNEIHYKNIK